MGMWNSLNLRPTKILVLLDAQPENAMPTYSKSYSAWLARQTAKVKAKFGDVEQRVENDPLALVFCIERNLVPVPRSKFNGDVLLRYFRWRFFRTLADMLSALSIPFGARTPHQIRLVHDMTLEEVGKSKPRAVSGDPALSFRLVARAMMASVARDGDSEYRDYALRILSEPPFALNGVELGANLVRIAKEKEERRKNPALPAGHLRARDSRHLDRPGSDDSPESYSIFGADADIAGGSWNVENSESACSEDGGESDEPISEMDDSTAESRFDSEYTTFESPVGEPWRPYDSDGDSLSDFGLGDCHDRPWIEGMLPAYAEVGPGVSGDSSGNWSET